MMSRSATMRFPAVVALTSALILVVGNVGLVSGQGAVSNTQWTNAHSTFYGGLDASGSMGGACGYGNLYYRGFGVQTAALSPVLFNGGASCGACFEIQCIVSQSKWCYPNAGSIKVTATNLCPANWYRTTDGWCNPPRLHFDLAYPMFAKLAQRVGGIIPVHYRRIPCVKPGGIRFSIGGNPWFMLVLVYNVSGAGDVSVMEVKSTSSTNFFYMTRNWGANWELKEKLVGEALTFRVTLSDKNQLTSARAVPQYWNFGSTYECSQNFDSY